jgi:error-prone DNA polymerase
VKGLHDAPLPLFAAADEREGKLRAEAVEPAVKLTAMGEGAQVVEDYRTISLSLRAHPLAFLRGELAERKMVPCADLRAMKDGRWVNLAGVVLVRQKPGSAKGVMFITLEDETDIANLVIWPDLFEKHRRVVLGASMMGVRGRVQREGEVIHVVAQRLDDLSAMLGTVGARERTPLGNAPRDIYIPDLRLGSGIIPGQPTEGIKIKPRDFR